QQLQYIQEHGLYEEELIRIDPDGRVTISLIMIAKQPWISNAAGGNKTNLTWIPQDPKGYGLS
ncbi:MAG: hypothetical protein ACXVHY_09030, partial [Methanobacterium sp.]